MPKGLMPWHKNWLIDVEYDRVDLVKEGANSKAHIKLIKSKEGGESMTFEEIIAKMKPEHAQVIQEVMKKKEDALTAAQNDLTTAQQEVAKLKESIPVEGPKSDDPEEILKSVKDPAIRSLLETQIAKAKAAEDEVRKVRESQMQAEAIAKAKEVPNLGAEESKLVEVYKKLSDVSEELRDDVFGIFKAASALASQSGAFGEVGTGAVGTDNVVTSEEEAWGQIEKAADDIAKSRNITKAKAIDAAIQENPELYQDYLKAQRG